MIILIMVYVNLQSINNNINVLSTKDRPCDIWRGNVSFDDYFNSLI